MSKAQLKKEYERIMLKAKASVGRKETMGLFKRAREIRKSLYEDEFTHPLLNNVNRRATKKSAA